MSWQCQDVHVTLGNQALRDRFISLVPFYAHSTEAVVLTLREHILKVESSISRFSGTTYPVAGLSLDLLINYKRLRAEKRYQAGGVII